MPLLNNKKNQIIKDLESALKEKDEIISTLEKEMDSQVDRLDHLVDKIALLKSASNELLDLIDYKDHDEVITNVTNFLVEKGEKKAAKIISKCKIGIIQVVLRTYRSRPYQNIEVDIQLFCPGDAYKTLEGINDIMHPEYDNEINEQIRKAFKAFFSPSYTNSLYRKQHGRSPRVGSGIGTLNYELNMKRIDPKESDLELFFKKVDRLKKMLKRKEDGSASGWN